MGVANKSLCPSDHSNSSRRMRATGLVVLTFLSAASVFATEDEYSSSSSSSSLSSSSMSSNSLASSSSLSSSSSRAAGASRSAMMSGVAASSGGSASSDVVDNRLHPAHEEYHGCQYVGEWGDCDPFKMIRIKEERLVLGDANCVEKKNTTKPSARYHVVDSRTQAVRARAAKAENNDRRFAQIH